jgi:glycerophosphoryl diester phosphodiesterase
VTARILAGAWSDARRAFGELVATDLAYKLLAFAVLSPLVGLALRLGLSFSGQAVLADQDILRFLLRPAGLVILVVMLALSLTIVALEQACLMVIGVGATQGRRIGVLPALRWVLGRARPVVKLALRLVAKALVYVAPFGLAIGAVYRVLLGEFDINYYLQERPPAFVLAVAVAGALVAALLWLLVPKLIGWSLSLPLLLFEGLSPRAALVESDRRVEGHRRPVARVLIVWGVGAFALATLLPGAVLAAGRAIAPLGRGNTGLVLSLMLGLVAVWAVASLVASLVGGTAFALLVVRLYEHFGGGEDRLPPEVAGIGAPGDSDRLRLTPARLLVALLLLAALAGAAGAALLERVKGGNEVIVIAHRGAAGSAPENTLASVDEALAQGTDFVEIDVQENAEGEVVVIHDSDLMKIAGVDLKVWNATAADLLTIDVGSWFAPEFSDQRVPLLRDVLRRVEGRANLTIELKYYGHDQNLEQRVVDIVEQEGAVDDCVIMSLEYHAVRKMRSLRPEWTVGLLTAKAVGDLTRLDADFLAVNSGLATRAFIRRAHSRGKQVWVWTVNDPVRMFHLMNLGVDGLITDEPGLARRVLERRSELNSVERLLVGTAIFFGASAPPPPASEDAPEGAGALLEEPDELQQPDQDHGSEDGDDPLDDDPAAKPQLTGDPEAQRGADDADDDVGDDAHLGAGLHHQAGEPADDAADDDADEDVHCVSLRGGRAALDLRYRSWTRWSGVILAQSPSPAATGM